MKPDRLYRMIILKLLPSAQAAQYVPCPVFCRPQLCKGENIMNGAQCVDENLTTVIYSGNLKIIGRPGKQEVTVLRLPSVRQSTGYTCGVSALQAVLFYYGAEYKESILAQFAGSTEEAGTSPEGIVQAVTRVNQQRGTHFSAEIKQNASIADIEGLLDGETPVIVDIQAWREADNTAAWEDDWIDGHYVVAIGYDDEYLYFEDPSLLGSIGFIEKREFLKRWHDFEGAEYHPLQSVTTQNLIIVIKGKKPVMPDAVAPVE
jgi:predicted double-glycine peptidase